MVQQEFDWSWLTWRERKAKGSLRVERAGLFQDNASRVTLATFLPGRGIQLHDQHSLCEVELRKPRKDGNEEEVILLSFWFNTGVQTSARDPAGYIGPTNFDEKQPGLRRALFLNLNAGETRFGIEPFLCHIALRSLRSR